MHQASKLHRCFKEARACAPQRDDVGANKGARGVVTLDVAALHARRAWRLRHPEAGVVNQAALTTTAARTQSRAEAAGWDV